jgi:MOSC domain-containing protein YiiM
MAVVKAVAISERKGVRKHTVDSIKLSKDEGIVGDAHGDDPVRQVSLLADESVDTLRDRMPELAPGDFAENILTEGLVLYTIPVGTQLKIGDEVLMQVTQIGKECHQGCEIRRITGDCVMPREGVFAKVLSEGEIKAGDEVVVL